MYHTSVFLQSYYSMQCFTISSAFLYFYIPISRHFIFILLCVSIFFPSIIQQFHMSVLFTFLTPYHLDNVYVANCGSELYEIIMWRRRIIKLPCSTLEAFLPLMELFAVELTRFYSRCDVLWWRHGPVHWSRRPRSSVDVAKFNERI